MYKPNQKGISILGRRMTGKGVVLAIILILMIPAFSIVIIQNTATIPTQKNEYLSIPWDVTMSFTNAGSQNDNVIFGEAPDATDGPPADSYDTPKSPPPMLPYIRAWFNDNLASPYDLLLKDYRHYPGTSKVWNLTVQWMPASGSSPTTITMSWSLSEFSGCEYTYVNLTTDVGVVLQNMLVGNTYTFSCPAYAPQNFKIICSVTEENDPPVFGIPSPANGSTGNPLSVTWSLPINDLESNTFSWTIQCSNGQSNSLTGASNGTKSLSLSGLAYSTVYKVWVNATDPTGSGLYTRKWYEFTTAEEPNLPPAIPQRPSGIASGKINIEYTYTTITTDPNHDQIYYNWSWEDGTTSGWLGPYPSNQAIQAKHTWTKKGNYAIKVKAKDIQDAETNWSESLPITIPTSNEITCLSQKMNLMGSPTQTSDIIHAPTTYNNDLYSSSFGYSGGSIIREHIDLLLSILRGEHKGENLHQLFRALQGRH
jgi:hypothetical protein